MRALMKQGKDLLVKSIPVPPVGEDDILISVVVAGLCRTDVLVAEGLIPGKEDVILGHEFSGVVEKVGRRVSGFQVGNRVTAMPILACGACRYCKAGQRDTCQDTTMLGVHRDGAFSEFISVPSEAVYKMPDDMPFRYGAYSEPVAAALSVLKAGIHADQKGVIYGDNRFGHLIHRILKAYDFENVDIYDPRHGREIEESNYDFAIETLATADTMRDLFSAIKPRGTIIMKSRKHELVGINFFAAIKKEITLAAVNYGDFSEAMHIMADGRLDVDGLLGPTHHALEDFPEVFERSKTFEPQKIFFNPYK
ncbi:MAG: alcohol dehydrogenase catalytic domain-containing protein [Pseudomonadota bacterium]